MQYTYYLRSRYMLQALIISIGPPPKTTSLPYTTLFRSLQRPSTSPLSNRVSPKSAPSGTVTPHRASVRIAPATPSDPLATGVPRSEEHTSELQSRENLVCRLLLEKKKTPQLCINIKNPQ